MKVFLVRHGQSQDRAELKKQSPQSPLSQTGQTQAEAVAQRLQSEKIDLIISSLFPRALQTAEFISLKMTIPVSQEQLIVEQDEPGAVGNLDLLKQYQQEEEKHYFDIDWKFKNIGESIKDVINRAVEFKGKLETKYLSKDVLLVSHGFFMRSLIAVCLLGESCPGAIIVRFIRLGDMKNGSISELEFDETTKLWRLRYLNDHLHIKGL